MTIKLSDGTVTFDGFFRGIGDVSNNGDTIDIEYEGEARQYTWVPPDYPEEGYYQSEPPPEPSLELRLDPGGTGTGVAGQQGGPVTWSQGESAQGGSGGQGSA